MSAVKKKKDEAVTCVALLVKFQLNTQTHTLRETAEKEKRRRDAKLLIIQDGL